MSLDPETVKKRALDIWRQQELGYPERVRRMNPDEFDMVSGAWDRCVKQAVEELENGPPR